jgi:hypothetical protein
MAAIATCGAIMTAGPLAPPHTEAAMPDKPRAHAEQN